MRKKLWLSSLAVATVAVLIVGVPALVIGAGRGPAALAVVGTLMVVAAALAAASRGTRRGRRAARGRGPAPARP